MPTFAQPRPIDQLGKTDRWLVNYMTFASVAFASCYFGTYFVHSDRFTQAIVALVSGVALLKALAVPSAPMVYRERGMLFLGVMCMVALLNILVSWNALESALRWILWFGTLICLTRISATCDGTWIGAIIRRAPWCFFIIYASLIGMRPYLDEHSIYTMLHLSGLYGNLILATGLFANKLWKRLMWSAVGLLAIYFSGAGGALFTVPIMFIPYVLYSTKSMPVKGLAVAGVLTIGGLFFFETQLFSSFLAIKASTDASVDGFSYGGLERLERSKDNRLELVQYGLALVEQNPLGTGLGHTYADEATQEVGVGHVHNGTLSMLIELGVLGFTAAAGLLLWIFLCIIRNPSHDAHVKAFYFTFFFTVFGRSLSENYTPLDSGNFFTLLFLLLSSYLFLNQKARPQSWAGPVRARGRMLLRPNLRPVPMPRPVGFR